MAADSERSSTSRTPRALSEKDLDEPELMRVLCELLETSDVEAVHVWLLHAPSLERALTLDLIRCALRVSERLDGDVLDLSDGTASQRSNAKPPVGRTWRPSASRRPPPAAAASCVAPGTHPADGDESYSLEKSADGSVSRFVYVSESLLNPPPQPQQPHPPPAPPPTEFSRRMAAAEAGSTRSYASVHVRPITVSNAAHVKSRRKGSRALESCGSFSNWY